MQTRIVMPQLGESVTEGTVDRWLKREGDPVRKDEPLVEVVTDKVSAEVPCPVEGTLAKIFVAEGQTVPSHTPIALMEEVGAEAAAPAERATAGELAQDEGAEEVAPRRVSPVVRRIAEQRGVDLSQVQGTGYEGRLRKEDVLAYIEQREAAPDAAAATPGKETPTAAEAAFARPQSGPAAPAAPIQDATASAPPPAPTTPVPPAPLPASPVSAQAGELLPLTPARRAIAERVSQSVRAVPQVTTAIEIDMTAVARLRERAKAAFQERHGVSLTYLPFFMRAVVRALGQHPLLNASWTDDGIRLLRPIHLGVTVAVPAPEGRVGAENLLIPVIHDAERLNVRGLAIAAADLAERARRGKLGPDELRGATFTVNNTGALGSILSAPILPAPQAGIVTLEAVVKRPVVVTDGDGNESIAIRQMANSCLTFDHRVLDGLAALRFLHAVKADLEAAGPAWLEEG